MLIVDLDDSKPTPFSLSPKAGRREQAPKFRELGRLSQPN
jgi:hypothetical protein